MPLLLLQKADIKLLLPYDIMLSIHQIPGQQKKRMKPHQEVRGYRNYKERRSEPESRFPLARILSPYRPGHDSLTGWACPQGKAVGSSAMWIISVIGSGFRLKEGLISRRL